MKVTSGGFRNVFLKINEFIRGNLLFQVLQSHNFMASIFLMAFFVL